MLRLSALLHADYRLPTLDYEAWLRATRRLTGDEREVAKAFERCMINLLLHNRDDHSRKFAFRLDGDRLWRPAPVFDLIYCQGSGCEHQTSVAGVARTTGRAHLLEVARCSGLDLVQARGISERLLDGVMVPPALATDLPIRKGRLAELRRALAADWRRAEGV